MTDAELDEILTLQLAFAWAGETSDPDAPRLGWWRTDFTSEFGGLALLERLTPRTFKWAALEAAREAARVVDARAREADADADELVSLFHLGHPIDEQLDDRLHALKANEPSPEEALPRLRELIGQPWTRDAFTGWLAAEKPPAHDRQPSGLRIKAKPPERPIDRVKALASLLATLPDEYPCAHYRDAAAR